MAFTVGETVVYPHHGAALIEEIKTRIIKGEERQYLVLKVAQGDLTIEVPAQNVDLVGVRDVVGQEGLDRVFQVLRAPYAEEPTNWSRRYKANLEKLASGDVIKVAEVVRDLWRRDQDRGLSAGEKRMLAKARCATSSQTSSQRSPPAGSKCSPCRPTVPATGSSRPLCTPTASARTSSSSTTRCTRWRRRGSSALSSRSSRASRRRSPPRR